MRTDFAIFIMSHGRADNVFTYDTLKRCGNTNKVYIICDNEDKQLDRYYQVFGKSNVIVFDKLAKSKEFDTMDIPDRDRRAIVYARNACFDIAKDLGLTYFLELDDDYTMFRSRLWTNDKLATIYVTEFDKLVDETLKFLDVANISSVAWAQTGDFIGGSNSYLFKKRCTRKAMNSFFCRTDRKFNFIGRINEDVNTYVSLGKTGHIFFTVADISLNQPNTQHNSGGMSELYLDSGTYVKSFYTVIANPSCVKIGEMGGTHRRLHHTIDWNKAVPKIISSRFKKQ